MSLLLLIYVKHVCQISFNLTPRVHVHTITDPESLKTGKVKLSLTGKKKNLKLSRNYIVTVTCNCDKRLFVFTYGRNPQHLSNTKYSISL